MKAGYVDFQEAPHTLLNLSPATRTQLEGCLNLAGPTALRGIRNDDLGPDYASWSSYSVAGLICGKAKNNNNVTCGVAPIFQR